MTCVLFFMTCEIIYGRFSGRVFIFHDVRFSINDSQQAVDGPAIEYTMAVSEAVATLVTHTTGGLHLLQTYIECVSRKAARKLALDGYFSNERTTPTILGEFGPFQRQLRGLETVGDARDAVYTLNTCLGTMERAADRRAGCARPSFSV